MLTSISLISPSQYGIYNILFTITAFTVVIILEITEHIKDIKEKRTEERQEAERHRFLIEILGGISSANYPITPFRLFFTLKHTVTDEFLDEHFKGIKGYKSVKPNKYLKMVSTMSFGDIPFNSEDESPEKSHYTLQGEIIEKIKKESKQKNPVVKLPSDIKIEIYTPNSDVTPEIVFESNYMATEQPDSIREIRLYDNSLYQDTKVTDWKIKTTMERAYGLKDFKNCRMKIIADFFIHDRQFDESYPRFINLQLFFGALPVNLIYFKAEDLINNQKTYRRNPLEGIAKLDGELANELFQTLALEFNIKITDEFFANHTIQFNK